MRSSDDLPAPFAPMSSVRLQAQAGGMLLAWGGLIGGARGKAVAGVHAAPRLRAPAHTHAHTLPAAGDRHRHIAQHKGEPRIEAKVQVLYLHDRPSVRHALASLYPCVTSSAIFGKMLEMLHFCFFDFGSIRDSLKTNDLEDVLPPLSQLQTSLRRGGRQ